MTDVLRRRNTTAHTHRGTTMKRLKDKDHLQAKERGWNRFFTYGPQRKLTLMARFSWTSSLQDYEKYISIVLSHAVCGILL